MSGHPFTTSDSPGRRVRAYREALGLSQGQLGDCINPARTHAAISDIERGKTQMTVDLADSLAAALGVTRWDLIGDVPLAAPDRDEAIAALLAALVRVERENYELRARIEEAQS